MKIPLPASAMRVASGIPMVASTTLPAGRCQDVASWISRGGGADALDLTRIGMQLTAMSSYALVSSLLLGSGLYLFAITPLKVSDNKREGRMGRIEKAATAIFSIMITINIVSSLHTAIVFNVMTLYANTALGQGLDQGYIQFWNAPHCQALRKSAFYSFITAILSFKYSFILSVFSKTDGKHRSIATIIASVVMLLSGIQFWQMVHLASKLIFIQ